MAEKEKKDVRKLTIAISTASIVPVSTAVALNQSQNLNEQQDDQGMNSKELDGSKSYIEEEKKNDVKDDSISDSVYANRVREEKRAERKARTIKESLPEHSAKEVLLQNMESADPIKTLPEQNIVQTEPIEETVLAPVESEQLIFFNQEPEARVLPVYSAQSAEPTLLTTQGQPAAVEIEMEPAVDQIAETSLESDEKALITPENQIEPAVAESEAEPESTQVEENTLQAEAETTLDDSAPVSEETIEEELSIPASETEQQKPEEALEEVVQETIETTPLESEIPAVAEPVFEDVPGQEVQDFIEELTTEPAVQESVGQPEIDADLNDRIAQAALGLVGTTNGLQCTEVVTEALVQAGVDATLGWPADYLNYGSVVEDPAAGNLVYYNNGGEGLDHIAVYVGDGQAVHGNFTTESGSVETVVYDVQYQPEVNPVYIQVEI